MAKIVFYGDNPLSATANAYMNTTIIKQLEKAGHDVIVFGFSPPNFNSIFNDSGIKSKIIPLSPSEKDVYGEMQLMYYLQQLDFDFLVTNNDLWRMSRLAARFSIIKEQKSCKWFGIFPCDCDMIKPDWVDVMKAMDMPIVYSKHGFDLYCEFVNKLRYWKPTVDASKFKRISNRDELKKKIFNLNSENFLIGVVAKNQFRKDLVRSLEVFQRFNLAHPDSYLYLHTDKVSENCGDISQIIRQMGVPNVILKYDNVGRLTQEQLCNMYNAFDCLLVTSLGEGLCYPIIEAQLCEIPVIGAGNTAITELINEDKGYVINLSNETAPLPITVNNVVVTERRKRIKVEHCLELLEEVYTGKKENSERFNLILKNAKENAITYTKSNDGVLRLINRDINKVVSRRTSKPKDRLLFCQYASAGDIIITTGILEGLKKKYNTEVDYMTQPMYFDILEGNPHINKILEWDMKVAELYKAYAYPHKVIRTGNWGTNSVTLYDVYARLCDVPYGEMFIEPVEPVGNKGEKYNWENYITVHNKGGHHYRFYPYMEIVVSMLKEKFPDINFLQIGSKQDPAINGAVDLRGVSFRESAFVIKNALIHIGVDSFPSHCAAAVKTKQVCIYGSGSSRVVAPRGEVINVEPDYLKKCPIIGPCWGNYANCSASCIRSIDPKRVAEAAFKLMGV